MIRELIHRMSELVLGLGPFFFPDAFPGMVDGRTTPYPEYRSVEDMDFSTKVAFFFFPDAFLISNDNMK